MNFTHVAYSFRYFFTIYLIITSYKKRERNLKGIPCMQCRKRMALVSLLFETYSIIFFFCNLYWLPSDAFICLLHLGTIYPMKCSHLLFLMRNNNDRNTAHLVFIKHNCQITINLLNFYDEKIFSNTVMCNESFSPNFGYILLLIIIIIVFATTIIFVGAE